MPEGNSKSLADLNSIWREAINWAFYNAQNDIPIDEQRLYREQFASLPVTVKNLFIELRNNLVEEQNANRMGNELEELEELEDSNENEPIVDGFLDSEEFNGLMPQLQADIMYVIEETSK